MITTKFQPPPPATSTMRYEKLIASNIKHIRAELFYVEHNIGDLSSRFASKELVETIAKKLDNVSALSSVTEGYIEEWESECRHYSGHKHADPSLEEMKSQYRRETARAKRLASLVKDRPPLPAEAHKDETSTVDSLNGTYTVDYNFINDAKTELDWEDRTMQQYDAQEYKEDGYQLSNYLMETRNEGIKNIRTQIQQARDIFNDIATIVAVQDGGIQEMEKTLKQAAKNSEEAAYDVESLTVNRHRSSRKRRCLLYVATLASISLICYYLNPLRKLM